MEDPHSSDQDSPVSPPTIAVLGHTIVHGLRDYINGDHLSKKEREAHFQRCHNFNFTKENVAFFSTENMWLVHEISELPSLPEAIHEWLSSVAYLRVIVLQIGNEDLRISDHISTPQLLANKVFDLARFILYSYNVGRVTVAPILTRPGNIYPDLNRKIQIANSHLRQLINRNTSLLPIDYIIIKKMYQPCDIMFKSDHLTYNARGYKMYYRGVRGAFLKALGNPFHW